MHALKLEGFLRLIFKKDYTFFWYFKSTIKFPYCEYFLNNCNSQQKEHNHFAQKLSTFFVNKFKVLNLFLLKKKNHKHLQSPFFILCRKRLIGYVMSFSQSISLFKNFKFPLSYVYIKNKIKYEFFLFGTNKQKMCSNWMFQRTFGESIYKSFMVIMVPALYDEFIWLKIKRRYLFII